MAEALAETPTTPVDPVSRFDFETGRRIAPPENEGVNDSDTDKSTESDDDDDDEVASASEEEDERPVLTQIEALKRRIKSTPKGDKPDWKKIWKDFPLVDDRKEPYGKSEKDGRTILHHLILECSGGLGLDDDTRSQLLGAIKKVAQHCPSMLSRHDNFHRTPLYEALMGSYPKIVKAIVDRFPPDFQRVKGKSHPLTKALRETCGTGKQAENCFHVVMRLREKAVSITNGTFQKLCDMADESTISAPDGEGRTPVHHALHYQYSSQEQYDLILQLLDAGGTGKSSSKSRKYKDVLDQYIIQEKIEMSLYQYHRHTRKHYIESQESSRPKKSKSSKLAEKTSRRSEKKREGKVSQQTEEVKQNEVSQAAPARNVERQKDERAGNEKKNPNRQPNNRASTVAPGSRGKQPEEPGAHTTRDDQPQTQHKGPKQGGHKAVEEVKIEEPKEVQPPQANMRLARSNTGSATASTSQGKLKAPEESKQEREDRRNLWSDRIQDVLKMKVLRYRSHNEATKFLYGKNTKNVQIYFDYRGQVPNVHPQTFSDSFDGIEFDSVLKYVAFPRVEVEGWKNPPAKTEGRSDMVFFFDWLRSKKVKRILRVSVDDTHQNGRAHSDEAIERCLKGMEIEELEWRKDNLDPETICRIDGILRDDDDTEGLEPENRIHLQEHRRQGSSENVSAEIQEQRNDTRKSKTQAHNKGTLRKLDLWWSGDNAVLRGWSDPEGLRMLPQLKSIRLTTSKATLESSARTERNIAMFKRRMSGRQLTPAPLKPPTEGIDDAAAQAEPTQGSTEATSKRVQFAQPMTRYIEVVDMEAQHGGSKGSAYSHGQVSSSKPSNRWVSSTKEFAKRINSVWDRLGADSDTNDIVVALIDDGVDLKHQQLQNKVLPGRTFASDGEMVRPWYQSEKGHGTVMARAICHVCPMAKIYPLRLHTTGPSWHTAIDANSAIEAIEAAVDKKVDIISISWTVQVPKGDMKERFKLAIERALKAEILIFTSSADSGKYEDKYWPSGYSPEAFIRVGAAKPDGTPAEMIGDHDKLDFFLPGVDVRLGDTPDEPDEQTSQLVRERSETGSSIATALGAGLAAMLLYCTTIAVLTNKNKITREHLKRLHRRNDMKNAFMWIVRSKSAESDSKFVEVSQVLDNGPMNFSLSLPIDQSTTVIAEWVRDLLPQSQ